MTSGRVRDNHFKDKALKDESKLGPKRDHFASNPKTSDYLLETYDRKIIKIIENWPKIMIKKTIKWSKL